MNWQHFQTYNEASTRAFEAMCNQLFELWVNREYRDTTRSFVVVNGSGGDGGVESYARLVTGEEIGVQAKWFLDSVTTSQFTQIKKSIITALEVHPKLIKYIICIPRDLSNSKKGKDGKIVQKTEYSKWNKIIADIRNMYHKIDIILWGDHILETQLQYADAAGVRRYWFEKEELTKEAIQYSFDKQKKGWLVQRYIPVLHNQGKMHKEISSFLGKSEECLDLLRDLKFVEKNLRMLIDQIGILYDFVYEKNLHIDKLEKFHELQERAAHQLEELLEVKNAFQSEEKIEKWNEYIFTYDELGDLEKQIDQYSFGDSSFHFWDIQKLINKLYDINMPQLIEKLKQRCNFEKVIVIGGQGTGKTHGIANVVEVQLKQNYHIPILVQAKSISSQDEWKDIIIRVLGLSQNWSEEELWSALEALSYRNEINHPISVVEKEKIRIVPKVIICIDGIDEIKPYERWNERICQVNAIVSKHKRIRFCFTGRQYAFNSRQMLREQNLKKITLYDDGDVPVRTIYDAYMRYYNIDDEGAKWLRYSISTPYAVKLVCELYEGKNIGKIGKSDVIVTNLLREKFDRLNREFKISAGLAENTNDQIVKIILLKINEILENQNEITHVQLKSILRGLDIYNYLNEPGIDKILDFLEKHSFLQSYQKCAESFFENDKTIYFLGTQPVYDYLKALRLFERSNYSDDLELDKQVLENMGALQMYSVMILEREGKTLWQNKSCRENLPYEENLFSAVAFALINVNENISGQYEDWLKNLMSQNTYALSLAVNKIILPLARNRRHPLGSILLNQYLNSFNRPADRDIIWSIPSGLNGNEDSIWVRPEDIEYTNESYKLEDTDCYDGMPLVWAWGLTSVDNRQRTMIRQEITKWGIIRPEEFYKLFEHFVNINDDQAKTDIFAIAMSVTYVCRKNRTYLKAISKWIYHNVFQYGKIKNIHNAAIRYYSRAIMECAFSEGAIASEKVAKCLPPYRTGSSFAAFAPEATTGTMMRGYKTMDYNLARYVLCEPLNRMFLSNRDYKREIDNLVEKYGRKYQLPELTCEKWILGCAFGVVKAAGWRENIFYGKPNGGRVGEKLGVDIAIRRKFSPATHGSMSRVMSITEKYIWCAKMELLGYLADRLPYHEYGSGSNYVDDYGQLENYVNPYQEFCQIDFDKVMEKTDLILPEELAPFIKGCDYSKNGIQKWLLESPIPNFEKWINVQQGAITLYGSHCVSNEAHGVTTMMWISSGLIQKGTITSLVKKLKDRDFSVELINAANILAYPNSNCYVSPLEVCWFDWKDEHNSEIVYGNNVLYKNVARCMCDTQEKGEKEYEMPSKKVRKMMGIVSGDGYHYYNDKGIEIANYREAGERFGNSQYMLLVNKEIFISKASELDLQPIWVVRVLKEMSYKARERFDCFIERDETYLVWKNNQRWQMRRIECTD